MGTIKNKMIMVLIFAAKDEQTMYQMMKSAI